MNKKSLTLLFALSLLFAVPAVAVEGPDDNVFHQITHHYETVRLLLVQDSVDGVPAQAKSIHEAVESLHVDFDPSKAGIDPAQAETFHQILPELTRAARALTKASDLASTRDAFYDLSKPLVRYRAVVASSERPAVAYCPMARRSWLQPEGEIGNPYHGQSMARCGNVVEN